MEIMALALGGCLRAPPVQYGITEDTGGHITYVLGAMQALAERPEVERAEIVTRMIDDPDLGPVYSVPREPITDTLSITRIDTGNRRYLSKEDLAADLMAFQRAFLANLRRRKRLPDLIHAHFSDAAQIAAAARKEFGIPFIYTAHSLVNDKIGSRRNAGQQSRFEAEDFAIAQADAIIASSRDECERQLPAYPSNDSGKVHRVIPGVEHMSATREEIVGARRLLSPFLRQPDRPLVLAIARPVHKKNLVVLVEAFASLAELRQQANLAIVAGLRKGLACGEAEQRQVLSDIIDAIDRHDLYGSVAWPRQHTQADINGLYAMVRETRGVFVNPARMEPYGLTLVEAAAHGAPVVATRNGGPVDIISDLRHGTLIDPGKPDEIAKEILNILTNRELWNRYSANGARRSAEMDWAAYARDFVAIAKDVLAPSHSGKVGSQGITSLVLSDIDNTLTGCSHGARTFNRWIEQRPDVAYGIATGRSLHEATRMLRKWELPLPRLLITDVGTRIWWRNAGRLAPDRDYEKAIGHDWEGERVVEVLANLPGLGPQRDIDQSPLKKSYVVASSLVAEEAERMLRVAGLKAKCIFSHGKLFDVVPRNSGKAGAMKHAAARLDLPLHNVVAIGDSGNDHDMLSACPNAVLVANYSPELNDLASDPAVYVAKRKHAGGALEGIENALARGLRIERTIRRTVPNRELTA